MSFFQFFDIKSILAYTIAFVIVMIGLELLCFKPLDNYSRGGEPDGYWNKNKY